MKTEYNLQNVQNFLSGKKINYSNIEQFARGHASQAFGFTDEKGNNFVLRIASNDKDFLADKFAYDKFGKDLLIPEVIDIDRFYDASFCCISRRAEGMISDNLTEEEMVTAIPAIYEEFIKIFKTDISHFDGYGHPDTTTGDAPYNLWHEVMSDRLDTIYGKNVEQSAKNIGIDTELIKKFRKQYMDNLQFASETRRLTHGDLGFDNLLIKDGKVTAVIDWAGIGYGDWMYDFAKLGFWWPSRFGDAKKFAEANDLEAHNLEQRNALYWARTALSTIQWADEVKNAHISDWLRTYVKDRIVL